MHKMGIVFPWMKAYEEQVNLELFNAAIKLAAETTEAHKEVDGLLRGLKRLPWYQRVSGLEYFERADIRYFGELLERYGEKLGDTNANTRAIALAMSWCAPILTQNMFIGKQRDDFMVKLSLMGESDTYIATALYRLSEGTTRDAWRANLIVREYKRTEEIILALCSMDDPGQCYDELRPALAALLGDKRTLPVEENAGIYAWLAASCFDTIKACRKKDNAVPKAIASLALGYLREDKPAHKALLVAGYTPREILYLNSMFLWDESLRSHGFYSNSIPAERLATAFVQAALGAPEPQKESTLDYIYWLSDRYSSFAMKYEGNAGLWMAVCKGLKVVCPETLVWMCRKDYKYIYSFDVLDDKWDLLARELHKSKYDELFRTQLDWEPNASAERLRAMLDKYKSFMGRDFLTFFDTYNSWYRASLNTLVRTGIIDLWDFFEKHRDDPGSRTHYGSLEYVWNYASGVKNRESYEFWKRFYENYDMRDLPMFFPDKQFHNSFFERTGYWNEVKRLAFKRDFLNREENRQLCEWIEASAFVLAPQDFTRRATEMLESPDTEEFYDTDELRPIFIALLTDEPKSGRLASLKPRFMSQEELDAEKEARERKAAELERAKAEAERSKTCSEMNAAFDGTLKSIYAYLDKLWYRGDERRYAAQNAKCLLAEALSDIAQLDRSEYRLLLKILADIVGLADGDDQYVRGILGAITMGMEEKKAC